MVTGLESSSSLSKYNIIDSLDNGYYVTHLAKSLIPIKKSLKIVNN